MRRRLAGVLVGTAIAAGLALAAPGLDAQRAALPRTFDGQPDLQGVWDYRSLTPLERPTAFAGKEFLTADEAADYERRAAARPDGRPPDDPRVDPSVHPADWLDYGRKLTDDRRSSLIIDPPDGRIPALTPEAVAREAARRTAARSFGSADNPENRSLWERCVTRGLPEGLLPAGYNNNVEILQAPGYVILHMEMIHDARIVPIDAARSRPRPPATVRRWLGDSVGHWEGTTLVVETTNFTAKTNYRGAGAHLRLVERFTRVSANQLDYRVTIEDPTTWVRPWTIALPMVRSDERVYEYACHEGNYGLHNILRQARTLDRIP